MPFLMFGKKTRVRAVKNGRREERKCPKCGETALFAEAEAESTYNAYKVIELFSTNDEVFICGNCEEYMELDETEPKELSAREQAKLDKAAEKQALKEDKARAQQAKAKSKAIDDELAAIKARVGKKD